MQLSTTEGIQHETIDEALGPRKGITPSGRATSGEISEITQSAAENPAYGTAVRPE